MSTEVIHAEIKWYDRKLLTRSVLIGLVFFAIFWGLAKRAEPPEGYVFERLPAISGIYRCCDAGGRYSKSSVGPAQINCLGFSFYQLGTGRNDCGLRYELGGVYVEVGQVYIPTIWGKSPLVRSIYAEGVKHYELSDDRMRELWISGSGWNSFTLAFIFFVIFHTTQMILRDRRNRKFNEENK